MFLAPRKHVCCPDVVCAVTSAACGVPVSPLEKVAGERVIKGRGVNTDYGEIATEMVLVTLCACLTREGGMVAATDPDSDIERRVTGEATVVLYSLPPQAVAFDAVAKAVHRRMWL